MPAIPARPVGRHRQGLSISQRPNAVLDTVGDLTNLLLVDDKRRRQDQRIAKGANKDPVFETMVRHGSRPLTGSIRRSFDLYGPKQAEVANIADYAAGAPDVVNGGFPFPGDARDFLEDAFLLIDIRRASSLFDRNAPNLESSLVLLKTYIAVKAESVWIL